MNNSFPTADWMALHVQINGKRDLIAEHEDLVKRIACVLNNADCYTVTFEVPNEHVNYIVDFLSDRLYRVIRGLAGYKTTMLVIDFSHHAPI